MNDKEKLFYSRMFFAGSFWNISIAIVGMALNNTALKLLFKDNLVIDNLLLTIFFQFFMIVVLLFGIGYMMVSMDLEKNRGVIWLGMIAKIIIFGTFSYQFFIGNGRLFLILGGGGDFLWSGVFLKFLWDTRNMIDSNNFVG